jgi:aryl-alcohol dehydrogenase-like predicted oxidoreductase
MRTLDDLVRAGKVRYLGLSDVPAWYLSRAQTLAELRGLERLAGLQLEYSLAERNIEREHVPAALALGLGITPWSPLASGLLTGKYSRDGVLARGEGRLPAVQAGGNPGFEKLMTDQNWRIVDTLVGVARELGRPPAQVALSWVARRPGVSSVIVGATKVEQLEANLRALEVDLPAPLLQKLDEVSAPPLVHPYHFFTPQMRAMLTGGTTVVPWPR